MGWEFRQGTVAMVCLCSMLSGTWAGDPWRLDITQLLGARIIWKYLHSHVWMETGLEWLRGKVCQLKHLHVASSCDLGFLIAWRPQGSPTSYVVASWLVFYDPVWEATHHFCPIWLVKTVTCPPRSKRQDIDDLRSVESCQRIWGPCVKMSTWGIWYIHTVQPVLFSQDLSTRRQMPFLFVQPKLYVLAEELPAMLC